MPTDVLDLTAGSQSIPIRTSDKSLNMTNAKGIALLAFSLFVIFASSYMLLVGLKASETAADQIQQTLDVNSELISIGRGIASAESAQRGYLLTSNVSHLGPYYEAMRSVQNNINKLQRIVDDNPQQLAHASVLFKLIEQRSKELSEPVLLQSQGDVVGAREAVSRNGREAISRNLNARIAEMQQVEEQLLQERLRTSDEARHSVRLAFLLSTLCIIILVAVIYIIVRRELRRRGAAAIQFGELAERLHESALSSSRERNEVVLLNEAVSYMQSCDSFDEIAGCADELLQNLFPGKSGAIYVTAASRNRLDRVTGWGDLSMPDHMAPSDCWGLRRGQMHDRFITRGAPACDHCTHETNHIDTLCIPLVAQGETIGLIVLSAKPKADIQEENVSRLADMVARQIGLTLANLQLRENLSEQTIRDPMTNAFNRRYLDVVAEKEMARAARHGRSLSVAMIDVDHFKRFNDTHGHQAGDAALVAVSKYLQQNSRDTDWLFRYGGEEFLLLLTDVTDLEAYGRLDELRRGIADLAISYEGRALPSVTMSAGLAAFPGQFKTFEELVSAADEALYMAKQGGRNRVQSTPGETLRLAVVE